MEVIANMELIIIIIIIQVRRILNPYFPLWLRIAPQLYAKINLQRRSSSFIWHANPLHNPMGMIPHNYYCSRQQSINKQDHLSSIDLKRLKGIKEIDLLDEADHIMDWDRFYFNPDPSWKNQYFPTLSEFNDGWWLDSSIEDDYVLI